MLKAEMDQVKEVARAIAKEEIAKALKPAAPVSVEEKVDQPVEAAPVKGAKK